MPVSVIILIFGVLENPCPTGTRRPAPPGPGSPPPGPASPVPPSPPVPPPPPTILTPVIVPKVSQEYANSTPLLGSITS